MSSPSVPPAEASPSHGIDLVLQAFLRREVLALKDQVAERDAEIAVLHHKLEARPGARFLAALTVSYLRLLMRCRSSLRKQVMILETSELFDAHWYARHYPQCGGSAFAAIHYLRVGALKGYDPGPDFSTSDYYLANPDVAGARFPALAHYLLRGREEGRLLYLVPAQATAD